MKKKVIILFLILICIAMIIWFFVPTHSNDTNNYEVTINALVDEENSQLERPRPFASFETENPINLLNELMDTVKIYGFNISRINKATLEFEARKNDPQEENAEDRILIWLDRDEEKPLEEVHLFYKYGRFEEVWTRNKKDMVRIKTGDAFEYKSVGKLIESILKLSLR